MTMQTLKIFDAILDEANNSEGKLIRGTFNDGKGTKEEKIKYVEDYAFGAFGLVISGKEANFISELANEWLDRCDAGEIIDEDKPYYDFQVKLEEFKD